MSLLAPLSRVFIALAMLAFGVQHLVYGAFVTRLVPSLPSWVPAQPLLARLFGIALFCAGLAILVNWKTRRVCLLLAAFLLLSALFLYLPQLFHTMFLGGLWTNTGKVLALAAGCLLIAASLRPEYALPPLFIVLERLIPAARFLLAAFFLLAGIQHFLFVSFVAALVPAWISAHVFWTYLAGAALFLAGIGLLIPSRSRLGGLLSGSMILLWVFLLHIPRALAAPHDSNETTAVFEALAVSGTAFLVAVQPPRER